MESSNVNSWDTMGFLEFNAINIYIYIYVWIQYAEGDLRFFILYMQTDSMGIQQQWLHFGVTGIKAGCVRYVYEMGI